MNQSMVTSPLSPTDLVGRDGSSQFQRRMPGHVKSIAIHRQQQDEAELLLISTGVRRLIVLGSASLLAFSLLLYGLAVFLGDEISRAGHSPSTELLEIVTGNDVLLVPANQVRFRNQRRSGNFNGLEIYLHWPSMSGYTEELREEFNNLGEDSSLLFVSIEPRSMSQDMSGRIEPIYSLFFDGKREAGPNGLSRQPLSVEGGYIDEDLFFEENSPYPFVTRCVREGSQSATPFCIRDIHVGRGLMLTYRFHKNYLNHWMDMEQAVRKWATAAIANDDQ